LGSSTADTPKTTFAPSGRCGTSASVSANGPRWFVANDRSQPNEFFVGRVCMIPALLSRPTICNSCDDLSRRAPKAGNIRQIAHDRRRVRPFLLNGFLDLVEPHAITADQHDRVVPGKFERRGVTYAGSRAGNDMPCDL
jgi:hypothetical protein